MRKIMLIMSIISLIVLFSSKVEAVGVLPRFSKASKSVNVRSSAPGIGASVRLRSDHQALNLYLSNLGKARQVTYTLYYQTNGKDEGVSGSVNASSGDSLAREVLFGTCSAGVCRYHTNITGAKLEILSELLSGKKTLRKYRIKV